MAVVLLVGVTLRLADFVPVGRVTVIVLVDLTGLVIVFKAIDDTVGVAGVKLADLVAVDYPS